MATRRKCKLQGVRTRRTFSFQTKKSDNKIGGVGFFSSQTFLPINIAWDVFEERNGCESFDRLKQMILQYRMDKENLNSTIGCIILTNPSSLGKKIGLTCQAIGVVVLFKGNLTKRMRVLVLSYGIEPNCCSTNI